MIRNLLLINYTFIKKWMVLGYLVFFLGVFLVVEYFVSCNYDKTAYYPNLIATITWEKLVAFLGGALLIVGLTTHVFKNPRTSHLDLIVVASKMHRRQLIVSKMLAAVVFILVFCGVFFITALLGGLFYKGAGGLAIFKHAASLAIGEFVIMTFVLAVVGALAMMLNLIPLLTLTIAVLSLISFLPFIFVSSSAQPNAYRRARANNFIIEYQTYNQNEKNGLSLMIKNRDLKIDKWKDYGTVAFLDFFNQWGRAYDWVTKGDTADPLAAYTYRETPTYLALSANDPKVHIFTFKINDQMRDFVIIRPIGDGEKWIIPGYKSVISSIERNAKPDFAGFIAYDIFMGKSTQPHDYQALVKNLLTSPQFDFFAKLKLLNLFDHELYLDDVTDEPTQEPGIANANEGKKISITEQISSELEKKYGIRHNNGVITLLPNFELNNTDGADMFKWFGFWLPTLIELDEIVQHNHAVGIFAPTDTSLLFSNRYDLVYINNPLMTVHAAPWIPDNIVHPIWGAIFFLSVGGISVMILRQNIS